MNTRRNLGEIVVGVGLVAAGILFLLSTLDVVDALDWWRWLPALLIVWGVLQFVSTRGGDIFGPLFLIGLGTALLLAMTQVISWAVFGSLWPLLLVFIGIAVLLGRRRVDRIAAGTSPEDAVDVVAVLGSNQRSLTSQAFKGGEATAVMGGAKLDLRTALPADGSTLNVTIVMGGLELYVPEDWQVDLEATAVLGGVEDKRVRRITGAGPAPRLRITGFVLMGGVEVKS